LAQPGEGYKGFAIRDRRQLKLFGSQEA
jgi:hypothetical protein